MSQTQSNFLRPQPFGFDVIYDDYLVARAITRITHGYRSYDIIVPGGEKVGETPNKFWIGERVKELIYQGKVCTGELYTCSCPAHQEEQYEIQKGEIDAEMAIERHYENAGWAEAQAFENYERSMGLS